MNWRQWIPFLGFVDFDDDLVEAAGLDPCLRWRGLVFEWLGCGMVICARGSL